MFQEKRCFLLSERTDVVIQYVLKQQEVVETLTVLVIGVYLFYIQKSLLRYRETIYSA